MVTLLALLMPLALVTYFATDDDDDDSKAAEAPASTTGDTDLLDTAANNLDTANDGLARPDHDRTADGRRLIQGDEAGGGVVAGDGDDVIFTRGGDDFAVGGAGDDEVFLGDGNDEGFRRFGRNQTGDFLGDEGNDLIRGGGGDDVIKDRQGADRLFGDSGNDVIDARDTIRATAAPDVVFGGSGSDILTVDTGDTVTGGTGQDRFVLAQSEFGTAPAIITDYQPGEILGLETNGTADNTVQTQTSEDGAAVEVLLDQQVVARLEGFTDPDGVTIVLLDDLDALSA